MSNNDRRTIQGDVPDGVVDGAQVYTHNPNPDDELALQRERFAQQQGQLQQDREQAAEALEEVNERLADQYQAAQQDPAHQAFVPAQQAALEEADSATDGGAGYTDEEATPSRAINSEIPRVVPTRPAQDTLQDNERP